MAEKKLETEPTSLRWAARVRPGTSAICIAAVFVFFGVVTAVLFWPWVAHISTALIGPPEDNMQDYWNTWYAAVAADPRHFFFTNLIRFPEGAALNYHSFSYPQVFAVVALTKIFGAERNSLLLLQNLTLLLSFPLAGSGAFLLIRHFTRQTVASLVGAYVFAFSPWHIQQIMHHAHVSEIGFIPFFVFAYLKALESKSLGWIAVAVVFYVLSALSCWYYLFYLAFFVVFHTVYLAVRDHELPWNWNFLAPLICVTGTVAILSPILLPMVLRVGGSAYEGGWNTFVVDLSSFFIPSPTHLLIRGTTSYYASLVNNPWEGTAYLGAINLSLLVWYFLQIREHRDPKFWYAFAGIVTFSILACGAFLHVFGRNLWVPLPDLLFWKLPFFANIRTPSRVIVLVYLFLAIGVGCALTLAIHEGRGFRAHVIVAVAIVLLVFDFVPSGLAITDATCPKVLDIIRYDPEQGFGVLNWPRNYAAQNEPMFQQTCHGRPVVVAVVSRVLSPTLIDKIETRDLLRQRDELRRAHVKYIVMRPPGRGIAKWMPNDGKFPPYLATYPTVAMSTDFVVLKVY